MRTILTKCISARCAQVESACACRYKINTCDISGLFVVYQEGQHATLDELVDSPRVEKLTARMKEFVQAEIGMNSSVTPHVVLTGLCATMRGTPPLESQVLGYMKRWRAISRDDSMQPVIDVCSSSMFELQQNPAQLVDGLLVFCDSAYENGNLISDIGDASDELPFRLGHTCYSLLHAYTTVQDNPRCVTVIHLDRPTTWYDNDTACSSCWIVDTLSRACQCRFHAKYNIWPHIVKATKLLGVPCPGFKASVRRFQSRDKRSQRENARSYSVIELNTIDLDETNLTAEQDSGCSQGIQLPTLEPVTAWDYVGAHLCHHEGRSHFATALNDTRVVEYLAFLNK